VKNDAVYLRHMLTACERILEYLPDNKENLASSPMALDAISRNFQVLGEAAKSVSAQYKESHPEIHWQEISGMRNIIVHAYFHVDPAIIYQTAQKDVPQLLKQLRDIMSDLK